MLRRTVSGIMLFLLLVSTLTLAFNIQPVKGTWTGTVYIRADGSIDPPDAPIITPDNVTYTLTDNITSTADGIVVERDNIIIDGNGYTIQGTLAYGYKGISLYIRANVTIMNTNIKNFYCGICLNHSSNNSIYANDITANSWRGIDLYYSSNNSIYGNSITGNSWCGINLEVSSNNIIFENNIENNYYGIDLWRSSNNIIFENNITGNNDYGIGLRGSSNNSIYGNNITANNRCGIDLWGSSNNNISENNFINNGLFVWDSYQNSVENNTVNGRPLVYLEGASHHTVGDAGQVVLVRCEDIRVEGLNLSRTNVGVELIETSNSTLYGNNITANNRYGIYLYYSSNNNISENNITNNDYGIYLYYSSNNSIYGNNITANNWDGIDLYYSSNYNSIYGNNITANNWCGIDLGRSSNNNISENNITANNRYGIDLYYSSNNSIYGNNITANNWCGIDLWDSSDNIIFENNIENNDYGIHLWDSSNNSIYGNNIENNRCGIYLSSSFNNRFHHNNFINNIQHVYLYQAGPNVWDYGYPSGGNYWSDYTGIDEKSGPNQDLPGSDGIGDSPYVIDENNADHYPLMNPWGSGTPVASFTWTPSIPKIGESVTFDASASTPNGGTIVEYEWNFGDGETATGKTVTHTYTNSGTYTVTLNVTDSEGLWDTEQKQIQVVQPHGPEAGFTWTPLTPRTGETIEFDASASQPGWNGTHTMPITEYRWDFGDGNKTTTSTPSIYHTYETAGNYYVTLTVYAPGATPETDTITHKVTAVSIPVGGYSILIQLPTTAKPATLHIALLTILTILFTKLKRKTKRKH